MSTGTRSSLENKGRAQDRSSQHSFDACSLALQTDRHVRTVRNAIMPKKFSAVQVSRSPFLLRGWLMPWKMTNCIPSKNLDYRLSPRVHSPPRSSWRFRAAFSCIQITVIKFGCQAETSPPDC